MLTMEMVKKRDIKKHLTLFATNTQFDLEEELSILHTIN